MKAMGSTKKEPENEEPPLELEMRNRHVRTTETMIRNWVMYTKLLIQRLGRAQTHKLVDMASDECRLETNNEDNIVAKDITGVERDYKETEDQLVDLVIPDDDKLIHNNKVFFKDE